MATYIFNPNEHLMQLKSKEGSKDYLPVQWRLVWVNSVVDQAVAEGKDVSLEIDCEEVAYDPDKEFSAEAFVWNNEKRRSEKVMKTAKGYAKYKATVTLQIGGMVKRASAVKTERAVDFPDYVEKADTGATGRALAKIGFGTQFTGPEFDEGMSRIVDAPVDRTPASNNGSRSETDEATITEQQAASIRKLCQHIGKSEPDTSTMSYLAAKQLIGELTAEYRESRQNGASGSQPAGQENKPATLEERFKLAFKRALALNELKVEADAPYQAKVQAFLTFAGPLVNAKLTSAGQITPSRMSAIEAYLNAKDAA